MTAIDKLVAEAIRRKSVTLPAPAIRKAIRRQAGLTQADLASALGVSRVAVARWEKGGRTPRGHNLTKYATILERLGNEVAR